MLGFASNGGMTKEENTEKEGIISAFYLMFLKATFHIFYPSCELGLLCACAFGILLCFLPFLVQNGSVPLLPSQKLI